jgi:hypothetical protein
VFDLPFLFLDSSSDEIFSVLPFDHDTLWRVK